MLATSPREPKKAQEIPAEPKKRKTEESTPKKCFHLNSSPSLANVCFRICCSLIHSHLRTRMVLPVNLACGARRAAMYSGKSFAGTSAGTYVRNADGMQRYIYDREGWATLCLPYMRRHGQRPVRGQDRRKRNISNDVPNSLSSIEARYNRQCTRSADDRIWGMGAPTYLPTYLSS